MPPDFVGVSIGGPSREGFMIYPAYRLHNTDRASVGRGPYLHPDGTPHDWTFEYTPPGAEGPARLKVTLDQNHVRMEMPREHVAMGAHFNRFGLISAHTDGNGQHLYFDDLTYTASQDSP